MGKNIKRNEEKNFNGGDNRNGGGNSYGNRERFKPVSSEPTIFNDENGIIRVVIDDKFLGPVMVDGWKIYVNRSNRIICVPEEVEVKEGQEVKHATYTRMPGTIHIKKNENVNYVYFRSKEYQDFLDECGNPFILNKNPNGYYLAINGDFKNDTYISCISSDEGLCKFTKEYDDSQIVVDCKKLKSGVEHNSSFVVKDADIAVFDRVRVVRGAEFPVITTYRTIVTTKPIIDSYDIIRELIKANKECIESVINNL